MTKAKRAVSPQISFLDLDQNWFSSPTTKTVLSTVLPPAQQKTGAPDPDQMLRDFTSKLLSSMDVEPGKDLEASMKQAVLRKQLEECKCPKKYVKVAAEEMGDYQCDDLSARNFYRSCIDFAPAARRIRVLLLKQEHPDWLSVWTDAETEIMSGKADVLDYHLNPVNPEVFVKKMQEIKVNVFPQIILAYTCLNETEYDLVEEEWTDHLLDFGEQDYVQLGDRLALYGIYRKFGRFYDLPPGVGRYLDSDYFNWMAVEEALHLDSFPFRRADVFTIDRRKNRPANFGNLKDEEEASHVG